MGSASLFGSHFQPQISPKYKRNGQNSTYGFVLPITFDQIQNFKFPFIGVLRLPYLSPGNHYRPYFWSHYVGLVWPNWSKWPKMAKMTSTAWPDMAKNMANMGFHGKNRTNINMHQIKSYGQKKTKLWLWRKSRWCFLNNLNKLGLSFAKLRTSNTCI